MAPAAPPGAPPPTRADRAKCWAARDAYFACLDSHNLWLHGMPEPKDYQAMMRLDPTKPPVLSDREAAAAGLPTVCKALRDMYKLECLPSWSLHFEMLRVKDMQSKRMVQKVQQEEAERHNNEKEFWDRVRKKD
ncbi:hypothetical protein BC831DRAFT_446629 [Entophlyctis helioformis]|nr:hypothetical protein BC831DRAFT_446629 [Entophlyctis helioformis]